MNLAAPDPLPRQLPDQRQALAFAIKSWGLRAIRGLRELRHGPPARFPRADTLAAAPTLAAFESPLWPEDEQDLSLVVGKIHNLRLAARHLDGVEVPAGATFSFWRQLGRASRRRGFVAGRELREGCLVPAIGGGLCQLTNAIYDSALRAGLEVVERHRHSRVLPGSLAEYDRDATVFWNYLDLRLRAPFAWRIEVAMDADHLVLRLRGQGPVATPTLPMKVLGQGERPRRDETTGDCASCDETDCHRHTGPQAWTAHRTWLVEETWPEFEAYRQARQQPGDRVLSLGAGRAAQPGSFLARLPSRLRWHWARWRGRPIPQARVQSLEAVAHALMRRLGPDDLQLVVPQGLLPYLWQAGELAGRRFDVLMSALPMRHLQARLDAAAARHPGSPTLGDFRAPAWLVAAESAALARAQRWISPHARILELAGERAEALAWQAPKDDTSRVETVRHDALRLLFPASGLARKGVLELRKALQGLPVRVLVPPSAVDDPQVWSGLDIEPVASIGAGLERADAVVLPAWVEHQPRGLLMAMARGLPVIATPACGLPVSSRWTSVPEGDAEALREAIRRQLARLHPRDSGLHPDADQKKAGSG